MRMTWTLRSAALLAGTALVAGLAAPPTAQALPDDQIAYGIGATLPAALVRAAKDCFGIPFGGLALFPGCPAPSPADNVTFPYAPVGSGNGVNSFVTRTPQGSVQASPPSSDASFSPPITWVYPWINFAASESQLTAANIAAYGYNGATPGTFVNPVPLAATLRVNGPALQVPLAGTPVLVSYNPAGLDGAGAGDRVQLSARSYCGIFQGTITNWNDASITADNGGTSVTAGIPGNSLPIQVVVRVDSSGTSNVFSSRLRAQCTALGFPWTAGSGGLPAWVPPVLRGQGNVGVASVVDGDSNGTLTDGGATVPYSDGGLCAGLDLAPGCGRVGYNSPAAIEPVVSNGVFSALLQDRPSTQDGNPATNTFVDGTVLTTLNSAINAVRPPCAPGLNPPQCTGAPDAFTNPLNWSALQGDPANGILEDIEYPNLAGSYPVVGFAFYFTYSCHQFQNVAQGLRDFWRQITNRVAPYNPALWNDFGFIFPSTFQTRAIAQLMLIDTRTSLRLGGAPPRPGNQFPGCSSGAGPAATP
jgi:ABC-type phosphate transport system substrate-binding protein